MLGVERIAGIALAAIVMMSGVYAAGYKAAQNRFQQQAAVAVAAEKARTEQASKAIAIQKERYDKAITDASAFAASNAVVIDSLRARVRAASGRAGAACTNHGGTGANGMASRAADLAAWAGKCAKRADELTLQVLALQEFIRTIQR